MPHDAALADRMRRALGAHAGITEKRMMGGVCFFLNGNMLGGARRDNDGVRRFMFRVGKDQEVSALENPTARPVVQGGRKLGGFIHVTDADCDAAELTRWLGMCLHHAATLPPKK